eukprot:5182697-Lingulodinium_polyedra.AAC.1
MGKGGRGNERGLVGVVVGGFDVAKGSLLGPRTPEWKCKGCGTPCYNSRTICRVCMQPRPAAEASKAWQRRAA